MAYGNLPGGGFSGFLKADKPLVVRKRSRLPLLEWPTEESSESEEQEQKPLLKPKKKPEAEIEQPLVKAKAEIKQPLVKPKKKRTAEAELLVDFREPKVKRKPARPARKRPKKVKKVEKTIDVEEDVSLIEEEEAVTVPERKKPKLPRRVSQKKSVDYPKDIPDTSTEEVLTEVPQEEIKDVVEEISPPETEPTEEVSETPEEVDFLVKFHRRKRKPTFTYLKKKRSVLRHCPCLLRLFYSRRTQYRGLKALLGFPVGALFGFALYWLVLERIGAEHYLCWLLGILVGIGFAVSTQIRCICFLSIPACCGKAGRAFISTYIIAYVIGGPLNNILLNARESMRVISCTASLNFNHTVERFKLMFQPVKEIVMDFVGAGQKVQDDTKQLEDAFTDIENEVRDEDEVRESLADVEELDDEVGEESRADIIRKKFKKSKIPGFGEDSEKGYGMKSEVRCEGIFTKGVRGCYDSFGKAYDRCHSYLPVIGYLLCWPMKLTFICDLASSLMGKRTCDSNDAMSPGFGASVDTADGVQSEFEKDFAVQLQYKLTIPVENVDQLVPEDISGAMKYSFERRKRNLDFFTQLVDRILVILFLLVLSASRKYCNQYLRIIQFDNKYVTSYFRHIDARRKKEGKMVLLPLKKGEKLELSEPFTVKFSAEEKIALIISCIRLISEVLTVSILLLFDRVFYEFLDLIKRHAHVTYKQTGVHHIKMTIYGDGFVGNMVRGILKGFDKKHTADQVTTTEECLPLPTKLPQELVIRLYLIFLLMLVLIILESYALRLRRVICSFFYPKREKKRIIFLYNDRLKKRRSFMQHMRHRVRKQAREQAIALDSGVFFSLRKFYPNYFDWVTKLGLGLAQCLICNEKESKKCLLISCPECPFSYCIECWNDTQGKCYACLPDDDTEPSADSISDEEIEKL